MTCIVGVEQDGRVWIGGDSASSDGQLLVHRADPKVFHTGPYLIGYTTSWRMGQILQHSLIPPDPPTDPAKLDHHMATGFINTVRTALKDGGWASRKDEQEQGGNFLVGVAGRLYEIESDYHIGRSASGYLACGSGWSLAMGSLHTTQAITAMSPAERVRVALEAAACHCTTVAPPFLIQEGRAEVDVR